MLEDHALNRASWDELATIHGQDAYYNSEALCSGANSLIPEEEAALSHALGDQIAGKRILHLQCHLGFDAITFARRGARVTGLDFSEVALDKARALASRCGVEIDWVCADVLEMPESLAGSFDLVWATMGILCWITDVSAWMRVTRGVLRPGGQLIMIDGFPTQIEAKSLRRAIAKGWDYATSNRTGPQVQFKHSLESTIEAVKSAELRVTRFEQHTSISSDLCINGLAPGRDGRYRARDPQQAVLFTLIAQRNTG
jgi:SAM-dependent methyltransferase